MCLAIYRRNSLCVWPFIYRHILPMCLAIYRRNLPMICVCLLRLLGTGTKRGCEY
jgi:hypothetical protein